MLHHAIVADAYTRSSTTARTNGCTASTARGETNSAQARMPATGAAMPATMFHGNGHIVKPHSARVAKAKSSHRNATMSIAESGGRVPGAGSNACGATLLVGAG